MPKLFLFISRLKHWIQHAIYTIMSLYDQELRRLIMKFGRIKNLMWNNSTYLEVCVIYLETEKFIVNGTQSDQEIFLSYSMNSRTYRVFNQWTKVVMESINVIVHDHIKDKDDDNDDDVLPKWTVNSTTQQSNNTVSTCSPVDSQVSNTNTISNSLCVEPAVVSSEDSIVVAPSDGSSALTSSVASSRISTVNNSRISLSPISPKPTTLATSSHVSKNHPISSVMGDVNSGKTTRTNRRKD